MTPAPFGPRDWDDIALVAFDVDGTLYRQQALRLAMARELVVHALSTCDFKTIAVLRAYRRIRERLGDREEPNFEDVLIAETAAATSTSPDAVRTIVTEWIEQRPLRHLADLRYPFLLELFEGLRRQGKIIGVLSDYPARAKLDALELAADHVIYAGDEGIGLLKPNPRGLEALIDAAGTKSAATVLIGDRAERDGLAASRAGAKALIRSSRPVDGFQTFAEFDDPVFAPFLKT